MDDCIEVGMNDDFNVKCFEYLEKHNKKSKLYYYYAGNYCCLKLGGKKTIFILCYTIRTFFFANSLIKFDRK